MIDPDAIFAGLGAALMAAYGLEIGMAFLMRSGRESLGGRNDE